MEEGKIIKKSLWLFEYNRGDETLYIQQFYAVSEEDAQAQIREFARTAEFPVYWERLRHVPGGFTIGYSALRGVIYERPDGTIVEEADLPLKMDLSAEPPLAPPAAQLLASEPQPEGAQPPAAEEPAGTDTSARPGPE